jgi:hypothetical protein
MSKNYLELISDLENLYWAWEKLKEAYKDGADIWVNQFDVAAFECNLDNNLKNISEEIINNSYTLKPIYPIAYPKSKGENGEIRTRPTFYVNVRDQLTWIAVINIIGAEYDYQMPFWSFGHRLFISTWIEDSGNSSFGILKHGWYRNTTKRLYRNWRQSWPRFRRHISLTIKAMSGELYSDNLINRNKLTDAEAAVLDSNEIETKDFLKNKNISKYRWNGKNDIFWCSIDFSKFYPSIKKEMVLNAILKYNKEEICKESDIFILIERLLDFRIAEDCNWSKEEFKRINIENDDDIGLPTGLIVAGFLSNIAMLSIDKRNNSYLNRNRSLVCYRFVDDHIILSTDIKILKGWYNFYTKLISEFGIVMNPEKTEPIEFKEYLADEESIKTLNKCKIDPLNPTPLVTQTLLKLSMIANQDLNLLVEEEQEEFLRDIEHFFLADFSKNEIKKETQVSFALTILSRLIPNLKVDYSALNSIRKRAYSIAESIKNLKKSCEKKDEIKKEEIIELERKMDELENEEKHELNKLKIEYKSKVDKYYNLIIRATLENYSKPKLWLRLIQYCAKTGKNDILDIFNKIDKLLDEEEIDKLNYNAINTFCIKLLCDSSLYILSKYLLYNKFQNDQEKHFLENVFTQKNLSVFLEKLNSNKLEGIITKKILLLTYRFIFEILKSNEIRKIEGLLSEEELKVLKLDSNENNIYLIWTLKKLHNNTEISEYWVELVNSFKRENGLSDNLDQIVDYKFLKYKRIVSESTITLEDYIVSCSENQDEEDLRYSEYAALLLTKKLIGLFKKNFHSFESPSVKEMQVSPCLIKIKNFPKESIFEWHKLQNIIIDEIELELIENKSCFNDFYIPQKIRQYDYKELCEIYSIGVILWQMCNKIHKLPYNLLFDKGRSFFFFRDNESIVKYFPSSYSDSIIESCLSNINRETSYWANKKLKLFGFISRIKEEEFVKGYPPLIEDLEELLSRVNNAIIKLNENQISLRNNIGRQLNLISCRKPSVSFDILKQKKSQYKFL